MQALTVSQLNRQVKNILEQGIGQVYVAGEVSNLARPMSGHFYFTLKDNTAQIRCVFFKGKHLKEHASLADGQKVCVHGKLSVYEPRGDYQLIVDRLEDDGLGELHRLFELLKAKLHAQGLFDSEKKQAIPKFPYTIGVITSKSGAAVRDILATLNRRYKYARVIIYHSDVQGGAAAGQLIAAIKKANQDKQADVLILARGGGSMEDLWAFNDENLAHTIAQSSLPIVSGVGHEVDFTIADFVADLRAATPTAAAEAVSPNMQDVINYIHKLQNNLHTCINNYIQNKLLMLKHALEMLSSPEYLISNYWQKLDFLNANLKSHVARNILVSERKLQLKIAQLDRQNPKLILSQVTDKFLRLDERLHAALNDYMQKVKQDLQTQLTTLNAVSPLATLDRGYSITMYKDALLVDSSRVKVGEEIKVRLSKGKLACEVIANDK